VPPIVADERHNAARPKKIPPARIISDSGH
jgi:hypothetical protein